MPRLQIDLSEQRLKTLDRLMEEGGLSTRKDLFNNALTLLEWAVEESRKGNVIASIDERAGRYRELQMPFLRHAAAAVPPQESEQGQVASSW